MKKTNKLLTLAVAAAMMSPLAAQAADVNIYGKARMSLNIANNGAPAGQESSAMGISSNSSRLGFKGSEDLGNGMTGLWQYETDMSLDDAGLGQRDSYVGIKGGFGQVKAGRLSTPYKESTGSIDPFGDTPGDYNAIIRHDTRADNTLEYSTNDMGGLKVKAAMIFADGANSDDELPINTVPDADRDGISVSASYTQGPLMGSLAVENLSQGTGNAKDKASKLGVLYSLNSNTKIGGVYAMVDDGAADNASIYASVQHKMDAKNTLKAGIGSRESNSGVSDGATFMAFGIAHQYTKNVEVYALYAQVDNDSGSSLGLDKGMDGTGIGNEVASSLSFGINLNFGSK